MPPANVPVELPPLPYAMDALEPHMSKDTLEYHWGKHHRAYVNNLNKQIEGTHLMSQTLEEIVKGTWNKGTPTAAFNNAAQAWNHAFFWESMAPNGGGQPVGKVADAINTSFGSYQEFAKQFKAAGGAQFGSGWVWLVTDRAGKVAVTKSANAETPIVADEIPILTMDVWEHAYYLDYKNARPVYMDVFLEKLVNWKKVDERYCAAVGK